MYARRRSFLLSGALLLSTLPLAARPPAPGGAPPGTATRESALPAARRPLRAPDALSSAPPLPEATVSVQEVNSGEVVERDLCLTISLGAAAAAECGDLRLVHALPTLRTLNRARTPVLLYNSQHAHPHPLVAAHVSLPSQADSVQAVLRVNGTERARKTFPGAWAANTPKRIVLGYDAAEEKSGIYGYTLTLTAYSGATTVSSGTATGELVVVNRRHSPFGAGWWLAGLEELVVDTCGKPAFWIGGDGSVRRYTTTDCKQGWSAPFLDRPDSLKWDSAGQVYERILPGGVRVQFNARGQHLATVNRLGHATRFSYQGGRLVSISAPPEGKGRSYEFRYHASGALEEIVAPWVERLADPDAPPRPPRPRRPLAEEEEQWEPDPVDPRVERQWRAVRIRSEAVAGVRRVREITDPGGYSVQFGYAGPSPARITSRMDRRGATTGYAYDDGGKIKESRLDMGADASGNPLPPLVRTLRAFESLGLNAPVAFADAYAELDGPRTDTADISRFWLDRHGAPQKIQDALGNETVLTRADSVRDPNTGLMRSRYPALVTRVRYANGRVVSAAYDDRGHLTSTTDSSTYRTDPDGTRKYATTRYAWDAKWDAATKIVQPEGDSVLMAYDPTTGNRLWQQAGPDPARRVHFDYYTDPLLKGLLKSVKTPLSRADLMVYDALGNLRATRTPLGYYTLFYKDALGRDTLVVSPLDAASAVDTSELKRKGATQRIRYDVLDQVRETRSIGPTLPHAEREELLVVNSYDREGNLERVSRSASPDLNRVGTITTRWTYDPANRKVSEIAPDGQVDSTFYDPAGNPLAWKTRRGHTIRMAYDGLNRLRQRIVPGVTYRDTTANEWTFPRYPNCVVVPYTKLTQLCIPEDTATFTYDAVGNLLTANNRDARIRRTYHPNGSLETDTLRIRTYAELHAGGDTTSHMYGLRMGYDLNGRRTWLKYPRQLGARFSSAPEVVHDSLAYGYHPELGSLDRVRDALGNEFRYTFDLEGRTDTLYYPTPGHFKRYSYDMDGRLSGLRQDRTSTSQEAAEWTLALDARDKVLAARSSDCMAASDFAYTGLGTLREHRQQCLSDNGKYTFTQNEKETWAADALGNTRSVGRETSGTFNVEESWSGGEAFSYEPRTARLQEHFTYSNYAKLPPPAGLRGTTSTSSATQKIRYDRSGNTHFSHTESYSETKAQCPDADDLCTTRSSGKKASAHYYGSDNKLRVVDTHEADSQKKVVSEPFEEYRYDALGRRILRRSRHGMETPDEGPIVELIQRFVWDGDRILAEIQMPGGSGVPAAVLERDTDLSDSEAGSTPEYYGRVLYTHGSELDHPLDVVRIGYVKKSADGTPLERWEPLVMAPDWDWRNTGYGHAFYGPTSPEKPNGTRVYYNWPRATLFGGEKDGGMGNPPKSRGAWFGSLLQDQKDATGQLYRRNRYVDPQTGRFTQEDPIGLAGGLNVYGFAEGDPVTYSDPYGLCPDPRTLSPMQAYLCNLIEAGSMAAGAAIGFGIGGGGGALLGLASGGAPALATAPAGAWLGAGAGAGVGLAGGKLLTNVLFSEGASGGSSGSGDLSRLGRRYNLNANSPTSRQVLENLDQSVGDFVGAHRKGSIWRELSTELRDKTVREALESGGSKVRKLLIDSRFVK